MLQLKFAVLTDIVAEGGYFQLIKKRGFENAWAEILRDEDRFFSQVLTPYLPFLDFLQKKDDIKSYIILDFVKELKNIFNNYDYNEQITPLKKAEKLILEKTKENKEVILSVDFDDTLLFGNMSAHEIPNFMLIEIIQKLEKLFETKKIIFKIQILTSRDPRSKKEITSFVQKHFSGLTKLPEIMFAEHWNPDERDQQKLTQLSQIIDNEITVFHIDDSYATEKTTGENLIWLKIPTFLESEYFQLYTEYEASLTKSDL